MTINDLAFALVKNKDDKQAIKNWEKKIESWEKEKAYPTLDEIYQMAYIINLNPGELLAIRNRGRKQFYRESDDPPSKRKHWIELNEDFVLVLTGLARLFGVFALFAFCIVFYKFVDTFYGETGGIVEDQVLLQQIQKTTGQENEVINDGSVQNMVTRIRRESNGIHDNPENEISNEIEDENVNVIENTIQN